MECKELAGKVIQALTLYEEGDYDPEINIEFTDGTVFNACLRTEPIIEGQAHCGRGRSATRLARLLLSDTSALKHG
jgi:hypothetical protein